MKLKFKLVLAAATLLLQGCVGNPVSSLGELLPGSFDDSQPYLTQIDSMHSEGLNSIGPEKDRLRVQSEGLGLIDYAAAEAFLNRHLDRLKESSDIAQLNGRAYISAERGFNARASADGNIYIPIEMLQDLETEHELAALLAHELAHGILNHTNSDMLVKLQKKAFYLSAITAGGGNQAQQASLVDKRRVRNTLGMLLVSDGFLNPGWSRSQELDADRLGLDLLVKAGYNPEGMAVLLRKLEAWDRKNKELIAEREARRQALLEEAQAEAGIDLNKHFNLMVQGAGQSLKGLLNNFSESHPEIEKRIESLQSYMLQHHRRAARPPMMGQEWQRLVTSRQAQALIKSVALASQAQGLLADNQPVKAGQVALSAIDAYSTHQNFIRVLLADIRDAQGNKDSIRSNVRYGLKGRYPAYKLHFYDVILSSNDRMKLKGRTNKLSELFDSYGKPPRHYVDLITLARATDNNLLKSKLQIECRLSYAGEAVACEPNEQAANQEISYNRVVDMLL